MMSSIVSLRRCPCGASMEVLFNVPECPRCRKGGAVQVDALSRSDLVVGRVPDPWHGGTAAQRRLEGHTVRAVLDPSHVAPGKVWCRWLEIEYCSSYDFDFSMRTPRRMLDETISRPAKWELKTPADNMGAARLLLRNDYVLLVID